MKLHWKHEQENYMSFDIEQVCSFLRAQKEQVVKKSNDQSMLPIVVVERDESPVAIIISPNMNKDLATKAAIISKIGFDPNIGIPTACGKVRANHHADLVDFFLLRTRQLFDAWFKIA